MIKTLLIWSDAEVFGGHEEMFLALLPGLMRDNAFERVVFKYNVRNERLGERLAEIPRLEASACRFGSKRGGLYTAPFRLNYLDHVFRVIKSLTPSAIILVQGRIEATAVPLLVASLLRVPVLSYLPMAHSFREMELGKMRSCVADFVRKFYYRLPTSFVVPSTAVARQLKRRGSSSPVAVVHNFISDERLPAPPRRRHANKTHGPRRAIFIGRLDAHQKGLDRLLDSVAEARGALRGWQLELIGEGPSRGSLMRYVKDRNLADIVAFRPWSSRVAEELRAADLVLLPSRFEGVPLVLLECLKLRVPVLASEIDVYAEYLPAGSRCSFAADGALGSIMDRAVSPEIVSEFHLACDRHDGRNAQQHSPGAFARAVAELLDF